MYNSDIVELGQAVPGQPGFVGPTKPPSVWQNILGFLEKGTEFGFNIADKIKQIQTAQKARQLAQEQAKVLSQMQISVPVPVVQPTAPVIGVNWQTIALVGGGLVLLGLLFTRRR